MFRSTTSRTTLFIAIAVLLTAPAVRADRLSDKDVKALIERIDNERDRFEDQLDGKLKRAILSSPRGEVNVEQFLDDLQENVDRLKERFSADSSASAEVSTLLLQGSAIYRFMSTQPADLDGASEWNRLAASLRQLAAAYGTTVPVPDGQQVRRMNDREVKKAAEALAESADRFKKDVDTVLKSDATVDKAKREAAVKELDGLKQDAKKLASLVGDGRPASGEAKALLDRAARVRVASSAWPLTPAAKTAWAPVESGLDNVARAFDLPAR